MKKAILPFLATIAVALALYSIAGAIEAVPVELGPKSQAAADIARDESDAHLAEIHHWQETVMVAKHRAETDAAVVRENLALARDAAGTVALVLALLACALAFAVWLGSLAWASVQRARIVKAPGGAFIVAGHLQDPRTGWAVALGEPHQADQEHARLLTAGKVAQIEAVTAILAKPVEARTRGDVAALGYWEGER